LPEFLGDLLERHDAWTGLGLHPGWWALFLLFLMWGYGLGVVLGYHRVLTHTAAKLSRPLEYFIITFGAPAGTPVQWIGNHRHHHAHSDEPEDDHSPVHYGFWTAHAGWYLETKKSWPAVLYTFAGPLRGVFDAFWRPRTNQQYNALARDIAADPYYAWMSTKSGYFLVMMLHLAVSWGVSYAVWGAQVLLFLYPAQTFFYAVGDFVNSLCHMHGDRPFESRDQSTNIWWLSLISFGDSWHNGHHGFPNSVRCGLLPMQVDAAYLWCRLFEKLGLARELKVPSEAQLMAKLKEPARLGHDVATGGA
jgi:stearoyl-CoA desaturase (delta-9 desaturase)